MLQSLFKRKETLDFGKAIRELSIACSQCREYDAILPSVHYNVNTQSYEISFKCAVKEYNKKDSYFLALRRRDKFTGSNLEVLFKCALNYVESPIAFVEAPDPGSLPASVTYYTKDFVRLPNRNTFFTCL